MKKQLVVSVWLVLFIGTTLLAQETLPPLVDGKAPQDLESLWAEFDPQAEPLEVEVLKEWEEEGVVLKIVRYRIGIFKGQKSMMAAVYGYPKGGQQLPGLVQAHGGGQYAHSNAVLTNAKRGYATISLAWAGRIDAPGYRVNATGVKLFWDGATNDPQYRKTTDWGTLDAYHAPSRYPGSSSMSVRPGSHTLDSVESPRNCSYFLWPLAARRALTFLEQQPEVDRNKLGVYGHSMGGKITVLTAGVDKRVKAAAPSCGGISNSTDNALYQRTIADDVYLKQLECPIIFLSPSNDFHGHLADLQTAVAKIKTDQWRITCSPHHNHQDTKDYEVATQLWFDQHLKRTFSYPETPSGRLEINTASGVPTFTVLPDDSRPILSVDIYYTQQSNTGREVGRDDRVNRFWHYAEAKHAGNCWTGQLPLESSDKPLWVYANVLYALEEPISGAGYYYRDYTTRSFNLSSRLSIASPEELKNNAAQISLKRSLTIETFESDWKKQWFTYRPEQWGWRTHKVSNDLWKAPADAKLAFEARSEVPNTLIVGLDKQTTNVRLSGSGQWESIVLAPSNFRPSGDEKATKWSDVKELSIMAKDIQQQQLKDGRAASTGEQQWSRPVPELRNLRWIMTEDPGKQ